MKVAELVKNRTAERIYSEKAIPVSIVNNILQAGVWSSSIHSFQPWKFIVIKSKAKKNEIAKVLKQAGIEKNIDNILKLTGETIKKAPLAVAVCNRKNFSEVCKKFFKINIDYIKVAEKSEIEAISGAIQNMIMVAEELGLRSCWNTTPLFLEHKINKILECKEELVAIITFGYPANTNSNRSQRESEAGKIIYLK
jgi:nitroreductase